MIFKDRDIAIPDGVAGRTFISTPDAVVRRSCITSRDLVIERCAAATITGWERGAREGGGA